MNAMQGVARAVVAKGHKKKLSLGNEPDFLA